mgnify:CR=1 FL=1
MSKSIPRKLKKALKHSTIVYFESDHVGVMLKCERNTKWNRKAFCLIDKEHRLLHEWIAKSSQKMFEDAICKYRNRNEQSK